MTNEELSLKTKQALAGALKHAMERKKLSKITVSELIEACDLNRKTFYYHFENIYALLKWMLEQETVEVVKNFDLIVNAEEAIRFVMDYVEQNRAMVNSALDSLRYEEIKRFFYDDLFSVLYGAIEQGEEKLHVKIDKPFKDFLAAFYTEASAGLLIEWAKNPVTQAKEMVIHNLLSIYTVSMPAVLEARGVKAQGTQLGGSGSGPGEGPVTGGRVEAAREKGL